VTAPLPRVLQVAGGQTGGCRGRAPDIATAASTAHVAPSVVADCPPRAAPGRSRHLFRAAAPGLVAAVPLCCGRQEATPGVAGRDASTQEPGIDARYPLLSFRRRAGAQVSSEQPTRQHRGGWPTVTLLPGGLGWRPALYSPIMLEG